LGDEKSWNFNATFMLKVFWTCISTCDLSVTWRTNKNIHALLHSLFFLTISFIVNEKKITRVKNSSIELLQFVVGCVTSLVGSSEHKSVPLFLVSMALSVITYCYLLLTIVYNMNYLPTRMITLDFYLLLSIFTTLI
jgi:hypothetical protein